jgi:hypothetical protein
MTVENWITTVQEPRALFLAWQAPDHFNQRFRWAVGRLVPTADGLELHYFSDEEFPQFNDGMPADAVRALSYEGFPSFDTRQPVHRSGVADAFMRRLPPQSRADFRDFMKQFRLAPDGPLSPLALLGRTEAKLPSDGFSVVDPLDPSQETCDLMLEIAGFRYYVKEQPLGVGVGHKVTVSAEPDNPRDPGAVKISLGDRKIGNINRLQAPTFLRWLKDRKVTAVLERLNGKPDRPRAFIFARVRPAMRVAA